METVINISYHEDHILFSSVPPDMTLFSKYYEKLTRYEDYRKYELLKDGKLKVYLHNELEDDIEVIDAFNGYIEKSYISHILSIMF